MTESPCQKKCRLDSRQTYCVSCLRTLSEIQNWKNFNNSDKEIIIKQLSLRKK